MNEAKIVLGERTYSVRELSIRKNIAWRKRLAEPIKKIIGLVDTLSELEIERVGDVLDLVKRVVPFLTEHIDEVADWVISYSASLEDDRDYILDNAYESQLLAAFIEVLKLAYPFVSALPGRNRIGRAVKETLTNLPEQNGTSGPTN